MSNARPHIVEAFSLADAAYIPVAEISCALPADGVMAPVRIEYDLDAVTRITDGAGELILSSRIPASWDILNFANWPGFMTDLLPQGHARRYWTAKLGLPDGPAADWELLRYSGKNPVGNLRLQNKAPAYQKKARVHAFALKDIEKRSQGLLEYLEEVGEPVSSFTGAGGASPKFFLAEAHTGELFAVTALDESQMRRQILVKFPASSSALDKAILRAEAACLEFAALILGKKEVAVASMIGDALVTERFDRPKISGGFSKIAVESFYQRLVIPGHGAFLSLLDAAEDIVRTAPQALLSFFKRDLLNIVLANTDLHGRNYSFLRNSQGQLSLAPVYDLAPMAFADDIIVRFARAGWRNAALSFEESAASIDWPGLCQHLAPKTSTRILSELGKTRAQIAQHAEDLQHLLRKYQVSLDLTQKILENFRDQLDRMQRERSK